MGFDYKGYFEFADWLSKQQGLPVSDNIKIRNIVSRAYYSSLHESNEFYHDICRQYPPRNRNETTHKALIDNFEDDIGRSLVTDKDECLSDLLNNITSILIVFRDLRNMADYEEAPEKKMDANAATEAFELCGETRKFINTIITEYVS